MWQLPLTYLGTIVLAISAANGTKVSIPERAIFTGMIPLGLILLWCFHGAFEGYSRSAKNLAELEDELGIKRATRLPKSHSYPYLALMLLSLVFCCIAAIYSWLRR